MSAGQLHHREVYPHIAGNPIKPIPKRYIEYLMARGYALRTRRNYVDAVEQFTRWLGRRRIDRSAVQQFLQQSPPTRLRSEAAIRDPHRGCAALRHLLEMLGHSPVQSPFQEGYGGRLLRRYAQRLTTVRGLAASSVRIHVTCIRAMLRRVRAGRPSQFAKWTPELIQRYVSRAGRRSPRFGQKVAGCVRSFVRFLLEEGLIRRELAAAVPSFARWRLASLPETLRREEVQWLVRAADIQTSLDRRDQAIVLCLSELGLRASDVAGLELDGIDFTARVPRLRRRKEREITALSIPRRMAAALKTYIRDGRPACASSAVFVRHYAPVGKPITPMNVCNVVLRLAARAGLQDRVGGTQMLRHSLASRMLGAGATLKQIADLLGHTTVDTTRATRNDMPLQYLAQIRARPSAAIVPFAYEGWPEELGAAADRRPVRPRSAQILRASSPPAPSNANSTVDSTPPARQPCFPPASPPARPSITNPDSWCGRCTETCPIPGRCGGKSPDTFAGTAMEQTQFAPDRCPPL